MTLYTSASYQEVRWLYCALGVHVNVLNVSACSGHLQGLLYWSSSRFTSRISWNLESASLRLIFSALLWRTNMDHTLCLRGWFSCSNT